MPDVRERPQYVYISFDADGSGAVQGATWGKVVGLVDAQGKWLGAPSKIDGLPIAIRDGEAGTPWDEVRTMLDLALLATMADRTAEIAALTQERDAARTHAEESDRMAAESIRARDQAMAERDALQVQLEAALAANRVGAALTAEVADKGT